MAASVGNPSDILSSQSQEAAGQQPIVGEPLKPQQPPRFTITSRFVFYNEPIEGEHHRRRIQDFIYNFLAERYGGVTVEFGNQTTMHVAYGYPLFVWPKHGGIGPEIPPGGFPLAGAGAGEDGRSGYNGADPDGRSGYNGAEGGDDSKPASHLHFGPGPVVIPGRNQPDPVAPIADALDAAKARGLFPEGETWNIGPVIRAPVEGEAKAN